MFRCSALNTHTNYTPSLTHHLCVTHLPVTHLSVTPPLLPLLPPPLRTITHSRPAPSARRQRGSRQSVIRTARYTLPSSVAQHVDCVTPTTRLPSAFAATAAASKSTTAASTSASSDETIGDPQGDAAFTTPASLRTLYGATGVASPPSSSSSSSLAVLGFLDQFFEPTDITYFFQNYDPAVSGKERKKILVHGPNKAGGLPSSGEEATIDVSYGGAMAAGVNVTFWSTVRLR